MVQTRSAVFAGVAKMIWVNLKTQTISTHWSHHVTALGLWAPFISSVSGAGFKLSALAKLIASRSLSNSRSSTANFAKLIFHSRLLTIIRSSILWTWRAPKRISLFLNLWRPNLLKRFFISLTLKRWNRQSQVNKIVQINLTTRSRSVEGLTLTCEWQTIYRFREVIALSRKQARENIT